MAINLKGKKAKNKNKGTADTFKTCLTCLWST